MPHPGMWSPKRGLSSRHHANFFAISRHHAEIFSISTFTYTISQYKHLFQRSDMHHHYPFSLVKFEHKYCSKTHSQPCCPKNCSTRLPYTRCVVFFANFFITLSRNFSPPSRNHVLKNQFSRVRKQRGSRHNVRKRQLSRYHEQ